MFKKMLLTSAATSAAVGGLFAASLVATPAVVATAPEIRTVACEYAPEATSSVSVVLDDAFGQYGNRNVATATVKEPANATGEVFFDVVDTTATRSVQSAPVALDDNGRATLDLRRDLRAGRTYMVIADFRPADPCEVKSTLGYAGYSVFKRSTRTAVDAPNRRAVQRPVVSTVVRAAYQNGLGGKIRVVITKKGRAKALRATTVRLSSRAATVSFKRLRPGLYTAKVRYLGNTNYAASSGADDFRIRR